MRFDPTRWTRTEKPAEPSIYQRSVHINRPPEDVFNFIKQAESFRLIFPYKVEPEPELDEPEVKLNHVYPFKFWYGIIPIRWVAHITDYVEDRLYVDEILEGPMKFWRHTHLCEPAAGGGTNYTDKVEYAAPMGWLAEKFLVSGQLDKLFDYRHKKMKELLEAGAD